MDRSPARPIPPVVHYLALAVASVALFWGTTTAYYHAVRLGTAVEDTPLRHAVIAVHDFLGVWGVMALATFPFLWPVIFFFRERIGGLRLKVFGWLCAAGFASILAGLLGGAAAGGSFGAAVGGKLQAAMGQGLALFVCLAALAMALFLATERFFSLPAKPDFNADGAERYETKAPAAETSRDSGLSAEESRQIAETPRFDLEKVLEIEEEAGEEIPFPAPAAPVQAVAPPPAPAEEPVAVPAPAVEAKVSHAVEQEEEEIPFPPPAPPKPEEKAAELEEAVERATKDFILPPPPPAPVPAAIPPAPEPTASAGMLDNAARLVIQEGRASVSLLQRRLSIPFSRASLLLDLLEREGVIGPYRGGPSRDILLSLADWEQKQKSGSPDPALPQA